MTPRPLLAIAVLSAALSSAATTARAQIGNDSGSLPAMNLITNDRVKTDEEKQREAEQDRAYRAATKKIPAQAQPSNDPWGGVREPVKPTTMAPTKKQIGAK